MALPWKGGICMEIVQRRELWIHTHFVTDCVRLSQAQGRDIEAALLPVLRQQHIVYGIHFGKLVVIEKTSGGRPQWISIGFSGCHTTVACNIRNTLRFSSRVECCSSCRILAQCSVS